MDVMTGLFLPGDANGFTINEDSIEYNYIKREYIEKLRKAEDNLDYIKDNLERMDLAINYKNEVTDKLDKVYIMEEEYILEFECIMKTTFYRAFYVNEHIYKIPDNLLAILILFARNNAISMKELKRLVTRCKQIL